MANKNVEKETVGEMLSSETEIGVLCDRLKILLENQDFAALPLCSKSLFKSVLLISSKNLANKAFNLLLVLTEHYIKQADKKNAYKSLSGANLLVSSVSDHQMIKNFFVLKTIFFSEDSQVKHFSETTNKNSKGNGFEVISDFVGNHFEEGGKDKSGKLKRPLTAGRSMNGSVLSSAGVYSIAMKKGRACCVSRPNSAKKKISPLIETAAIQKKNSIFDPHVLNKYLNISRTVSRQLTQSIQILTPPKTPENLEFLNLPSQKFDFSDTKNNNQGSKTNIKVIQKKIIGNKGMIKKEKGKSDGESINFVGIANVKDKKVRNTLIREKIESSQKIETDREIKEISKKKEDKEGNKIVVGWNNEPAEKNKERKELTKISKFKNETKLKKGIKTDISIKYSKGFKPRIPKNREFEKKINPPMETVESHSLPTQEVLQEPKKKTVLLKTSFPSRFISTVIKIQSNFRGHLARERFQLQKSRKPIIKTCVGIIDSLVFHIRILKSSDTFTIIAYNNPLEYKQDVKNLDIHSFSVSNLHIKEGQLLYSATKRESSMVFTSFLELETIINKERTIASYSQNLKSKLIKVQVSVSDQIYEISLPWPSFKDLSFYSAHCVNNYLQVVDSQLEVNYPRVYTEKTLLYKVFFKQFNKEMCALIYRVNTSETTEIEICEINFTDLSQKQYFYPESAFSEELTKSVFINNSFIYFLLIDPKTHLVQSKLKSNFLGSIKKQMYGKDFLIRCFKNISNRTKFLFECFYPDISLIASIQLSEKQIKSIFKFKPKKIESDIEEILNNFTIKEEKLIPNQIETINIQKIVKSVEKVNLIKKIQRRFRAKFIKNKQTLVSAGNILLYKAGKIISNSMYEFAIYKLEEGLVIEGYLTSSKEIFFKYIDQPLIYISSLNKISDLRKFIEAIIIINNKLVLSRAKANFQSSSPEYSPFLQTPFTASEFSDPEGWPIFLKKDFTNTEYLLKAQIDPQKALQIKLIPLNPSARFMTRTFSQEEIIKHIGLYEPKSLISSIRVSFGSIVTSDFIRYSVPAMAEELLGIHIVSKIAVKYLDNMYLICAALVENLENYEKSELKFYARLNSSIERCRKTTISLAQASEITGIDSRSVVIIAEYISKNMIIVTNDEFCIDCSRPPVTPNDFAVKLQALVRGFRVRKKIYVKIMCLFKEVFKIQGSGFTVLVYILNSNMYLATVKGCEVFKSLMSEADCEMFHRAENKKIFVFEGLMNNLKKSDKKFTFLSEDKKRKESRRRPTIELAQASVASSLVGLIRSMTERRNEGAELLDTLTVTPNCLSYSVKVFKTDEKMYLEVSKEEVFMYKDVKEDVQDYEEFVRSIHVDLERKKILVKKKNLLSNIVVVDGKRVSIVVFENKRGLYLDGFVIDSQKPSFFYLGERAKVSIVMTKLRINSGKLVLSSYL